MLIEGATDASAPFKFCGTYIEPMPRKFVDTEGIVVILPVPVMLGISKKLKGRSSEERMILVNIMSIWYCSKILAYFLDIAEKSGVIGVVQPDRRATEKMPMLISFLVMGKGIDSSVGIGFSL